MEKSDRLSSLSNDLLRHILFFLPTKLSVATSILATRYRFLWAEVLNLDFDSNTHKMKPGGMTFADIITRVMSLRHVRDINSFRLISLENEPSLEQIESWIRIAIARNVQTIDIQLRDAVSIPPCLFTCNTLVDLRLHDCGSEPDAVFLPNLKRLHLHYFLYGEEHEHLQTLISRCPVLEELSIHKLVTNDLRRCVITSPTLKQLTLYLLLIEDLYVPEDELGYKLEINSPALRYISLKDRMSQEISTGTFNSLLEANICLYSDEVYDKALYSSSVLELVEKVSQVNCLTLTIHYRQILDSFFAGATWNFFNLTKLDLNADWVIFLLFLESADNLQELIFREAGDNVKRWIEPLHIPRCLSSHLRQVTINRFGYSENEFKVVRYLLKNGEFLKKITIGSRFISDLKKNQRLLEFEHRSETCELEFS